MSQGSQPSGWRCLDGHCKGISFMGRPRPPVGDPFGSHFGPFWVGHACPPFVSRSMPRMKNRLETSHYRLKTEESTLHSELRQFRNFQPPGIHGGRVKPQFFNSVSTAGRPAGRTHISKFYSNGQPSVAITRCCISLGLDRGIPTTFIS